MRNVKVARSNIARRKYHIKGWHRKQRWRHKPNRRYMSVWAKALSVLWPEIFNTNHHFWAVIWALSSMIAYFLPFGG